MIKLNDKLQTSPTYIRIRKRNHIYTPHEAMDQLIADYDIDHQQSKNQHKDARQFSNGIKQIDSMESQWIYYKYQKVLDIEVREINAHDLDHLLNQVDKHYDTIKNETKHPNDTHTQMVNRIVTSINQQLGKSMGSQLGSAVGQAMQGIKSSRHFSSRKDDKSNE